MTNPKRHCLGWLRIILDSYSSVVSTHIKILSTDPPQIVQLKHSEKLQYILYRRKISYYKLQTKNFGVPYLYIYFRKFVINLVLKVRLGRKTASFHHPSPKIYFFFTLRFIRNRRLFLSFLRGWRKTGHFLGHTFISSDGQDSLMLFLLLQNFSTYNRHAMHTSAFVMINFSRFTKSMWWTCSEHRMFLSFDIH